MDGVVGGRVVVGDAIEGRGFAVVGRIEGDVARLEHGEQALHLRHGQAACRVGLAHVRPEAVARGEGDRAPDQPDPYDSDVHTAAPSDLPAIAAACSTFAA